MRFTILFGAAAAIAAIAGGPAAAGRTTEAMMGSGDAVAAPDGYSAMCARSPSLCAAARDGDGDADAEGGGATLDERARRRLLRSVNRYVNGRVRPRRDRGDFWQPALAEGGGAGDCEDYAIEKRRELIAAGFPPRDLFYAVAYLRGVGLHAVLIARTAAGDVVLDNRTPWVSRWRRTAYTWVARQSAQDPSAWTEVDSAMARA